MRVLALLALLLPSPLAFARDKSPAPTPFAVMSEFDRLAARPLWPNFDARRVPVAIYDGRQTYLFRHPRPPAEFKEVRGHAGVRVFEGQHASVRANTNTELGGVALATAILDGSRRLSALEGAALIIHEAFHVFQGERHPKWGGEEGELFIYPLEDAAQLQLRRLETEALRRALSSKPRGEAAGWAAAALSLRRERFGKLPEGSARYERGTELKEGLAQYVQSLAEGKAGRAGLPAGEFAAEDVRARAYATGRALALLLDRLAPTWKRRLEAGEDRSLDELLDDALPRASRLSFSLTGAEKDAALARAKADVEKLVAGREALRRDFLAQPGWSLVFIADGGEPLWPQGFDPLNVRRAGGGQVLHTRWVKLGNSSGSIEVLDRRALTEAAGAHPLFNGMRRLTVAGLAAEPTVHTADGKTVVSGGGVNAELSGARVERTNQTLVVRLGKAGK